MSEIEKMYSNAGVKPTHYDACVLEDKYWNNEELANQYGTFDGYLSFECPHDGEGCYSTCEYAYDKDEYPPFTAEKQIKLIKWCLDNYRGYIFDSIETEWFEEQLCAFINDIWQDLTSEEKQQVKGILEVE